MKREGTFLTVLTYASIIQLKIGSQEERDTFNKADAKLNLPTKLDNSMTIKLNASQANLNGQNFETSVVVKNNTSVVKNCRLMFCAQTILHNGKPIQECGWKDLASFKLGPREGNVAIVRVV